MRKSRFSASQREAIVSSHLRSKTVEQLCEAHQISPATFYKRKNELETDNNEDKKRLKELESENLRLKKMYADLYLHNLDEVNGLLGHWYKSYNFDRSHSSLK